MITHSKEKTRHVFKFTQKDMEELAEIIWLLKHAPPPIGFNRNPLTIGQQRVVDEIYDMIQYPGDYGEFLNNKTGQ